MSADTDELLPADLVAQAHGMWQTPLWQRIARYLRARRDALVSAVDPPATERAVWIREGAVAELNRLLRGDAFLAEVIRDAQARRPTGDEPEEATPPPWMAAIKISADVVN